MVAVDRRRFFQMTAGASVGGALTAAIGTLPANANSRPDPSRPKHQFRAMWISSVENIDWPSATGLSTKQQKNEFIAWLDLAKKLNLNAVISQVRPAADAFWPSHFEPWSQYLTGTQGSDPGYDPLDFQVAEAHRRDLEYHAWFNPYRVSMQTDPDELAATHPARRHPDWVFTYGPNLYYNPGIPKVRSFVEDAMLDAVRRYDVDGVHFDDYFYPYPVDDEKIPDEKTFHRYGGGFSDIEDWRRHNVNLLVQEMHQRIHQHKPWVKFGISPFGVWRNETTDPHGSDTDGLQSYDALYADTRRWVKQGWVDYINPQIYWQIGFDVADYAKLTPWWADVVDDTDVHLYIGQAAHKQTDHTFDTDELSKHLTFNQDYSRVGGDVFFSATDVRTDKDGSITKLVDTHYSRPAIIPPIQHLGGGPPPRPVATASQESDGIHLEWVSPRGGRHAVTSYAVWRFDGKVDPSDGDRNDGRHLLATVRAAPGRRQRYVDSAACSGKQYTYVVSALDRLGNESPPSRHSVTV